MNSHPYPLFFNLYLHPEYDKKLLTGVITNKNELYYIVAQPLMHSLLNFWLLLLRSINPRQREQVAKRAIKMMNSIWLEAESSKYYDEDIFRGTHHKP